MSSTSALLATITEMQTRLLEVQQQLAAQIRREAAGAVAAPVVAQIRREAAGAVAQGAAVAAPVVAQVAAPAPSVMPRGRIPYTYPGSHATMNTAIRLQSPESLYSPASGGRGGRGGLRGGRGGLHGMDSGHTGRGGAVHGGRGGRGGAVRGGAVRGGAVRGGHGGHRGHEQGHEERKETVELDTLLALNESVFFHVIVKKDSQGKPVYTTCRSTFDGSVLTVVESEAAPSLIGQQSSKPGVILYQFMDALKESGQLKRSFTIAPWKLCYVVREGQTHTLESLLFEVLGKAKVVATEAVAVAEAAVAVADAAEAAVVAVEESVVDADANAADAVPIEVPVASPKPRAKPKMRKAASKADVAEVEAVTVEAEEKTQ